jgi:hypothetical protein
MRNRVRVVQPAEEGALNIARKAAAAVAAIPPAVVNGKIGLVSEYVQSITQVPNNSIAPGQPVNYLADAPLGIVNEIGIITSTGVPLTPTKGTVFQLPVGKYLIDWENAISADWSLAVWQGATVASMAIRTESIAGSSIAQTWIHGRTFVNTVNGVFVMVSPGFSTAAIPADGDSSLYMARITFLQVG